MTSNSLLTTPLDSLHRELGAKMVPFAGYLLPVHYPGGIIQEQFASQARQHWLALNV